MKIVKISLVHPLFETSQFATNDITGQRPTAKPDKKSPIAQKNRNNI